MKEHPGEHTPSPHDSQHDLALSIARAVKLGLPAPDSEEAITASVEAALMVEGRNNERTLAFFRVAALATLVLIAAVAYLWPEALGLDEYPPWPAMVALALLAGSIGFLQALDRGRYDRDLRLVVPVVDGLAILLGGLLVLWTTGTAAVRSPGGITDLLARWTTGATSGPPPTGFLGVVAATCAFLAFSGALRLSRRAALLSTGFAIGSWIVVSAFAGITLIPGLLIALTILATGVLGTRFTRVIRRVITTETGRLRAVRLYKDADAAREAREEVLKIVAHDLRNPLSNIGAVAQTLLEIPLREDQKKRHLEIIKRAAERMNRLIHDLLDVARMEAGNLPIEPRRVGVSELLGEVAEMMGPIAAAKELELTTRAAPELTAVRADPDRILQVFSNLIGNAVKFTPEGGRITVTAEPLGPKVRMVVADTGPGIPPDQLPRIFGRMWQAQKSDTRGLGLGLTIARSIVEAHGETIDVESRVGEGTRFWFTLPLDEAGGARRGDRLRQAEHGEDGTA